MNSRSEESRLYHGGKAGLVPGDLLVPSPPHVSDGCPVCVARAAGRTLTVGEYRAWAHRVGAQKVIDALEGAPDWEAVDPPTPQVAVYLTSDLPYARWYAARSRGDLYRVAHRGPLTPSDEDPFPTWLCPAAQVVEVIERRVRLDRKDRRALELRWKKVDARRDRSRPGGPHG